MDTSVILFNILFGVACAFVGVAKGRSGWGWFFLGFFFWLLALIVVFCVSDLNAEQANHNAHENEQRRLREQLKQERMKSEAFRELANSRLNAHDSILGVDTRALEEKSPQQNLGLSPENDGA